MNLDFKLRFITVCYGRPSVSGICIMSGGRGLLGVTGRQCDVPSRHYFASLRSMLSVPRVSTIRLMAPPTARTPFSMHILGTNGRYNYAVPVKVDVRRLGSVVTTHGTSNGGCVFVRAAVFRERFLCVRRLCGGNRLKHLRCVAYTRCRSVRK